MFCLFLFKQQKVQKKAQVTAYMKRYNRGAEQRLLGHGGRRGAAHASKVTEEAGWKRLLPNTGSQMLQLSEGG